MAEVIALLSYAAVARAYSQSHVAVAQAIAGTFPLLVFPLSVWLQQRGILSGVDGSRHFFKKFFWLLLTVGSVAAVVLL